MSLKERIYSVLVVSASDTFNMTTASFLPMSLYQPVFIVGSVCESRRHMASREFDFVIINAPLPDESATRFAIDCTQYQSSIVLLLCRNDVYAETYDKAAEHGVFILAKPTSMATLQQAVSWMVSARELLRGLKRKSLSIEQRMEEIRIVNRAKCLLISELKMKEPEAHRYIEKNAMDNCITKRAAAENIIRLYS